MARLTSRNLISIVIALLLVGVLLPLALTDLLAFTSTNATIQTLVATMIPVMAVIAIMMGFVPSGKSE